MAEPLKQFDKLAAFCWLPILQSFSQDIALCISYAVCGCTAASRNPQIDGSPVRRVWHTAQITGLLQLLCFACNRRWLNAELNCHVLHSAHLRLAEQQHLQYGGSRAVYVNVGPRFHCRPPLGPFNSLNNKPQRIFQSSNILFK